MSDLDWLPSAETSLTDAAIAYASHGFRVHAVWGMRPDGRCQCGSVGCRYPDDKSAGKHPIAKAWQKLTTSDVDAVREARAKRSTSNVGIALGGEARLVAVDIDGEKGRASWSTILGDRPAPPTLAQRTGRPDGGEQRIYSLARRHDPKRLGNRASFRYPGIDTRIEGGQIVVPPSIHGSRNRYEWILPAHPISEMPDWLFDALAAPAAPSSPRPEPTRSPSPAQAASTGLDPYLAKVLDRAASDVAGCAEGGRNQVLFAKSCTVFEYFIGEKLDHLIAWRAMNDAGRACGLPAAEVSSTISKAWRQAQKSTPKTIPPRTKGYRHEEDRDPRDPDRGVVVGEHDRSHVPAGEVRRDIVDPSPVAREAADGEAHPHGVYPSTWDEGSSRTWEEALSRDAKGGLKNTFGNVAKILRNASSFKGRWSYNEMRVTPFVDGRPLGDSDVAAAREKIEDDYGISPSKETMTEAILRVASDNSFHPVQRYLRSLVWDGQKRIERIIPDIFGSTGDAISQRMMRAWFVSAAARGLRPGCKVDTTLVLYGDQGFRKSTFFERLGGEWYSNSYVDVRDKDGVLQVHAGWIYEWAEIERITTKRDASDVKAFITIAIDNVRPPYGRGVVLQPRSGVIVGTTNKRFLDDETGSRRFWPITISRRLDDAQLDLLTTWRDQLWAEAVVALEAGETWWLTEEEERARALVAAEHAVEDAWSELISSYVTRPGRALSEVTTLEILRSAIGMTADRIDRGQEVRAGKALRSLGWIPRQVRRNGGIVRVYQREEIVTVVTGVVTGQTSTISPMSQPSQPSQVDLGFPEKKLKSLSQNVPNLVGCDVTGGASIENHSDQVSQPQSARSGVVTGPGGYPESWDAEE